ncbi:MAG: HDOD domain-containing protein [Pseudomonadota bacterium]
MASSEASLRQAALEPLRRAIVGRQPILDADLNVVSYELLFRDHETASTARIDGDQATVSVIADALDAIGLDQIVGTHRAFINFTHDLITDDTALLLPPDKVVIEVLENIRVTPRLVASLKDLHERGYQIALDDFVYAPQWDAILDLASIVKIDVLETTEANLDRQLQAIAAWPVQLLAEKVETRQQFEMLKARGFELFQGFFFAKPNVVSKPRLPASYTSMMLLLAELQDPGATTESIVAKVSQDVTLSYRLLRYLNSAFLGMPQRVDSITRAVIFIGLDKLKRWATLLALASSAEDKPTILLEAGLQRARCCELLAELTHQDSTDSFFIAGLFSVLDAVLDRDMSEVVALLPLAEDLEHALSSHQGPVGEALNCVLACEQCQWDDAAFAGLDIVDIFAAFNESAAWARQATSELIAD